MKGRSFIFCITIFGLIIVFHTQLLHLVGDFLVPQDKIERADAILVLSGSKGLVREALGVYLYKQGFARYIIRILEKDTSGFDRMISVLGLKITQEDFYRLYFKKMGIPEDALLLGPPQATSTYDEILIARDLIEKHRFNSIILVTSGYHMRRALLTAVYILQNIDTRIYHAGVPTDGYSSGKWWVYEDDIKEVIIEVYALVYYIIYHYLLSR